ncbi:hypothetical protein C8R48DRAFT_830109 [Suillus tomentosus]|nr:hypothetical protein C8R48DRAFT_830109 [Suillus tomentosus]
MTSTASQLERSLRKLQISESDSQETSTAVQWVPSRYYSSDASQCVLVRPPRAACGNRQLFGFPLIKSELWDMGSFAFKKIWPDRTLPDDHFFIVMNSLTLLRAYLGLRVCTMAFGKVDEGLDNIPSETRGILSNAKSSAFCGSEAQALTEMVGGNPTSLMNSAPSFHG